MPRFLLKKAKPGYDGKPSNLDTEPYLLYDFQWLFLFQELRKNQLIERLSMLVIQRKQMLRKESIFKMREHSGKWGACLPAEQ